MNKSIFLLFLSLFSSILNGAAASEAYVALKLSSIYNQSNLPVAFANIAPVVGPMDNPCKLNTDIDIPFISIADNIKDYVAGAYGKPYIPNGALLMSIAGKKFGLWENEKGIMCSIAPQCAIDDESWPRKLLPNFNKQKPKTNIISSILPILLKINKNGEIALENTRKR